MGGLVPSVPCSRLPPRGPGEESPSLELCVPPLSHVPSVLEVGWLSSRTSRNAWKEFLGLPESASRLDFPKGNPRALRGRGATTPRPGR